VSVNVSVSVNLLSVWTDGFARFGYR